MAAKRQRKRIDRLHPSLKEPIVRTPESIIRTIYRAATDEEAAAGEKAWIESEQRKKMQLLLKQYGFSETPSPRETYEFAKLLAAEIYPGMTVVDEAPHKVGHPPQWLSSWGVRFVHEVIASKVVLRLNIRAEAFRELKILAPDRYGKYSVKVLGDRFREICSHYNLDPETGNRKSEVGKT